MTHYKSAFLIHAHKDVEHLNRLIQKLCSKDSVVFIHLDAKSAIPASKINNSGVLVSPRINVSWGGNSQITALLRSLNFILEHKVSFDLLHFISGQDYPIKPISYFNNLPNNVRYLDSQPISSLNWHNPKYRWQLYHCESPAKSAQFFYRILRFLQKLTRCYRSLPTYLVNLYGGSTWWSLDQEDIEFILKFVATHPDLKTFLKPTTCFDELFVQTILSFYPAPHKKKMPFHSMAGWQCQSRNINNTGLG